MTLKSLLSPDLIEHIKNKTILLDTNAFIEGYSHPQEFSTLLDIITSQGCDLTTIEAVRLEFLSKNRNRTELTRKIDYYNKMLTSPPLATRTFEEETREFSLLFAFGIQSKDFKAVDFMLVSAMKKYASSILLFTNDHHDFTPQLFNLKALLPLMPAQGHMVPFGLYEFSEEKYAALIS